VKKINHDIQNRNAREREKEHRKIIFWWFM